jgi:hypothetical protein
MKAELNQRTYNYVLLRTFLKRNYSTNESNKDSGSLLKRLKRNDSASVTKND